MKLYTVNEALSKRKELNGKRVFIEGLLSFGYENISLLHWPKSEQVDAGIWVEETNGVFKYNFKSLEKLSGKKVVCSGEFQSVNIETEFDGEWGFGHMSLWPAQIVATDLVYYKNWYEANGTSKT